MNQELSFEPTKNNMLLDAFALSMLKNSPDIVFIKNSNLVYTGASQAFAVMVGVSSPSDIIGKTDIELFGDPALARRYNEDDHRLLASGKPLRGYIEPSFSDGKTRGYFQTSKYPLFDENGNTVGLYAVSRDVTREYKAKLNYEQELRSLFELPSDALSAALFDVTNWRLVDFKDASPNALNSSSYGSIDDYIELITDSIVECDEARRFYHSLSRDSLRSMFESGKRHISVEHQSHFPDDALLWVRVDLHFLLDPVNGNLCIAAILHNIDEEKQAEHALTRAAEWDSLTNVYNRDATMTHIRRVLTEEYPHSTHWLFMIDVDNFKLVNDTFGHLTGDEALVNIASSIRRVFRETDIVGRIGGDEFFALMKNSGSARIAAQRARELVEALQYVCSVENSRVELSGSVGVSCYSGDGKPLEQLYMEADAALYRAKQAGKNRYAFAETAELGPLTDASSSQEPISAIHLRTLLENMDASMFQTELTSDGGIRITYSSHSLFSKGSNCAAPAGARGENIWNVILAEDSEPLQAAIREASLCAKPLDHACRIRNSGGQIEWRHIRGTHLPSQDDGIRRMIHVATDITAQKQIEAELREKDSIIDFAMRNTDVNLWYFDYKTKECQLTKSCQKAHEMDGVESLADFPECLFGIGYVREDCVEPLRTAYERLRESGESFEFDVWFRRADGSGWWCERETISPLLDADGCVTRGIGIGKDVTAEKNFEEKFHTFQSYRSLAEKNTLASVRMNLTTGWCGDYISGNSSMLTISLANTVDGFFRDALRSIPTAEERAAHSHLSRAYLLEAFLRGETNFSFEFRSKLGAAGPIWMRASVDMMKNPSSGDVEVLYSVTDIDYEKNMNFTVDQLLAVDYEFLGLIDIATGSLMVFGDHTDSPEYAQNGMLYSEEMPRVFRNLILDEYYEEGIRTMSIAHIMRELEVKDFYTCSFPAKEYVKSRAGRKQWKFSYLDQSKSKILMTRTDITSVYTAERDPLTGLYNRETFYRRTREVLDAHPDRPFLLIRFDIDRFKTFNDMCGVYAGDRLLAELGRTARRQEWPNPSVFGRLQADHFVTLIPTDCLDISSWHRRLTRFFAQAVPGYRLSVSVGIYEVVDRKMDIALMCDRALLAIHTVKDSYVNKLAWYDDGLRDKLMREQALADEMEQALAERQFILYFQPLVDYDDNSVIGAEALVRWQHPKHGLIPPSEFVPLFEKNGFISKLDAYVWEKTCMYLHSWLDHSDSLRPVPVSVNISRCDLYDPELCDRLHALVRKYALPFSLLKLEITETAYMDDPGQLIGVVTKLRAMGFIVEMDDFGAGYSSLNMLKEVPVDVLKLDTRFLSENGNDERATTILSSIIRMARDLTLPVIAEGVETKAQADYLKALCCSKMQGYYFGRPMPPEKFEQLIAIQE